MSRIDYTTVIMLLPGRRKRAPVFEVHGVIIPARLVRLRSILVRHSRGRRHGHFSLSGCELLQLCHEKAVHVVHVRVEPETFNIQQYTLYAHRGP